MHDLILKFKIPKYFFGENISKMTQMLLFTIMLQKEQMKILLTGVPLSGSPRDAFENKLYTVKC